MGSRRNVESTAMAGYRDIVEHFITEINNGRLATGDRLPSERELIEYFGVARGTVRSAMTQLQSQGLVTAVHGKGYFVAEPSAEVDRLRAELRRAADALEEAARHIRDVVDG